MVDPIMDSLMQSCSQEGSLLSELSSPDTMGYSSSSTSPISTSESENSPSYESNSAYQVKQSSLGSPTPLRFDMVTPAQMKGQESTTGYMSTQFTA